MEDALKSGDSSSSNKLEFFVVQYFPFAVRDEHVNIGIILLEFNPTGDVRPLVLFTRNWRRLLSIDPQADIGLLTSIEGSLRSALTEAGQQAREEVKNFEESWSTGLRLKQEGTPARLQSSSGKGILIDSGLEALDRLMMMYVEDPE